MGNLWPKPKFYLAKSAFKRLPPDIPAPRLQATSGTDGRFQFAVPHSDLDEGSAERSPSRIMVVAEGHGCDWVSVVAPTSEELTFHLVKDVPIHGRILDPDGRPVAGAKLTVISISAPQDLGTPPRVVPHPRRPCVPQDLGWAAGRPANGVDHGPRRLLPPGRRWPGAHRRIPRRSTGHRLGAYLHVMTRAGETVSGGTTRRGGGSSMVLLPTSWPLPHGQSVA